MGNFMNLAILYSLPIVALCTPADDSTVTEYSTKVVYACGAGTSPGIATSLSYNSSSLNSTVDPTDDPDPDHDGLVNVSIFNDLESGKIMAEYTWDCNYYNCSSFSDYLNATSGLDKRNDNHGYDAWKNVDDIEKELDSTAKFNNDLVLIKGMLANHTYLGALSVYEDVVRTVDLTTSQYPDLNYFKNIWEIIWALFKAHNDKSKDSDTQKSLDAANILLMMVPNYYSVQTNDYENARSYLRQRFDNADNTSKEKNGILWTLNNDHPLNQDEISQLKKLASDNAASQAYITRMLNVYYQYGKTNNCEAGEKSAGKRIVQGWGAMKDKTDAASNTAVANTAIGWVSLFGLGIPVAAIYGVAAQNNVPPLTPESIADEAKAHSYSSISESTTASSISSSTSSTLTCVSTYPVEAEDDAWFDAVLSSLDTETTIDANKREVPTHAPDRKREVAATATATATSRTTSIDLVARADDSLTVDMPDLSDYCKGAGTKDQIQTCKDVLKRHTVQLDPKSWTYQNIQNNLDTASFYRYENAGKQKKAYEASDRLPIYVVNALGQSPGVACNALKFIATASLNRFYFAGYKSQSDAGDAKNGMLALIRGTRFSRAQVKRSRVCKDPSTYPNSDWIKIDPGLSASGKSTGYSGKTFQLDEFPPFSANLIIEQIEDIAITCVPDYDNSRDGISIGRFYKANGPKGDLQEFWGNKCAKYNPSISNYTDFDHYMPSTPRSSDRKSPLTPVSWKDYADNYLGGLINGHADIGENKAFIVVVNTKDVNGDNIKCSRYTNGNPFVFRSVNP